MKDTILEALQEKGIFIGYMMLCRYLNGRGYIRFGCNGGYKKGKTNGKDRKLPCPLFCPHTTYYPAKIRWWCKKLFREKRIYLEKRLFFDSRNPNSTTKPHLYDLFVIIAENKQVYEVFIEQNTLLKFIKGERMK